MNEECALNVPGSFSTSIPASGGDYNPLANEKTSAWARACVLGDLPKIKRLLGEDPKIMELRESMIRLSGVHHVIQGLKLLPRFGIPFTPDMQHMRCLQFLLDEGANRNAKDVAGHTMLHHCVGPLYNQHLHKAAKMLLSRGMDPNVENRMGKTPLYVAVESNQLKAVDLLLKFNADVTTCDNDGVLLMMITHRDMEASWIYFHLLQLLIFIFGSNSS